MISSLLQILYQTKGKYTDELLQEESNLGLGRLPKRLQPDEVRASVCGFCSTGCNLNIHMKKNQPINVTADPRYSVNLGDACPKGWEALSPLAASDRAATPYLRKHGKLEPVSWNEALEVFVNRFTRIQKEHGKESVAFLSTGQIPTEEMFFLGALTKFGMGFIHGDGNTRQCMATAAVAYKESFGFDAPPFSYNDLQESDCLVFVGANPCIAHPILWKHVMLNTNHPKIIVVDPRKTETAMAATHHYSIHPKSDLVLFYGLAHILIRNGWIDPEYIKHSTNHFEAFKEHVESYTPAHVALVTKLSVKQIEGFAELIHQGKKVSFWWTMGINQSHEGVRSAQALINLALMTGNIGRPGTGANSITGQCNAMGSRLYSNTTNLLGGHDFLNPEHRKKIASILNIDTHQIPKQNSLAYDQIIEHVLSGKIKGLWVIATNPAHSWINSNELHRYIGKLEFLVVQDMYHTADTAKIADMILPAAGWGEKDGTFINSERRYGRIRKVADAPGEALTDFEIFKRIANAWGCGRDFQKWESPEKVFEIMKSISKDTPCDISGIENYDMLDKAGGIQWPFLKGDDPSKFQRRLFENGKYFHADQKARFIFEKERALPEKVSEEYPYYLLTGRGSSSQWHTQTRTGKSPVLRKMYPQNVYVEINPENAAQLKITQREKIIISTKRGRITATAVIVPTVKPGQLFIPMHYIETNRLTFPAFDPYSRQPAYKLSAARVTKIGSLDPGTFA